MNNLQFIATYIHNNPGARYTEIIRHLMLWKGHSAEAIAHVRGQYSRYFTKIYSPYSSDSYEYHGDLWVKVNPKNRQSGYKLTPKGMDYVVQ